MSNDFEKDPDDGVVIPDELTSLKEKADKMGIPYHPSIGVEKLRQKVVAKLEGIPENSEETVTAPTSSARTHRVPTVAELKQKRNIDHRREANKLVRIRVTCMNPNKKGWPGEILSVSNAVIGTVKKYVPFNIEEGYHVPNVIYQLLKDRKYVHFSTIKLPNGRTRPNNKELPEFAIEVLDPLTPQELKDLAQRQAMNHSID